MPVRLTRTRRVLKLIRRDGKAVRDEAPSGSLIRLLAEAQSWSTRLRTGEIDIGGLAVELGRTSSYVTRIVRLAYLAPDVTAAIMAGRQRIGIDAHQLTKTGAIPASWNEQRRLFLPEQTIESGSPQYGTRLGLLLRSN